MSRSAARVWRLMTVLFSAFWSSKMGALLGNKWGQRRKKQRDILNLRPKGAMISRKATDANFAIVSHSNNSSTPSLYNVSFTAYRDTPNESARVDAQQIPVPKELEGDMLSGVQMSVTYDSRQPQRFVISEMMDLVDFTLYPLQNTLMISFVYFMMMLIPMIVIEVWFGGVTMISLICWITAIINEYAAQLGPNPDTATLVSNSSIPNSSVPQMTTVMMTPITPANVVIAQPSAPAGIASSYYVGGPSGLAPAPLSAAPATAAAAAPAAPAYHPAGPGYYGGGFDVSQTSEGVIKPGTQQGYIAPSAPPM